MKLRDRVTPSGLRKGLAGALMTLAAAAAFAGGRVEWAIPYRASDAQLPEDAYQRTQCKLDIYIPEGVEDFPTVVWFHGGGLVKGGRHFPDLKDKGIALVAVGYRLHPQANYPAFLDDAGAAVAWTLDNIAKYGGDPNKVFVSGASAGGYLSAMVGMDPRWLEAYGHAPDELAGIIPVTGQMTTHFNVKKWLGDEGLQYRPVVDENAPMYYVRRGLPPFCIIVGDRDLDFPARVSENQFMADTLKVLKNKQVEFYALEGLSHTQVSAGAAIIIPGFIERVTETGPAKKK
ncbi:alpha/beta hydrolase [Ruficoccus sp. ZRK36]|uniref:alpha/beta hydrolase n=1 Tax=Ruficoccus sp. ZRK36 TaxID=2866311 RepID=UPI001C72BC76|nr:alpha/beta hydrolase [Ruficoccus sp. ZRK36]QYY36667.1 alpha/beta hydrolase [Ruficoccus sp. ZRK36]